MKFYIAGIGNFAFFLRIIVEIILKNCSHPNNVVAVAETHFLTHYRLFYLDATGVTRIQSVVLLRIGGRGHFRSRDKGSGHTIRPAIADNPMLYANFTTLSFIDPELLPIEVLHCGNRKFRVFLAKNSGNYFKKFCTPKMS